MTLTKTELSERRQMLFKLMNGRNMARLQPATPTYSPSFLELAADTFRFWR